MFMIFSLLVYLIFGNVAYTWMFSIFKVARFCNLQLSIAASAIASHVVMLAAIALAPLGMDWIFEFDRDK
ncbi:MAG: hypothetical protein IJ002_04010 [Clostridia bacterium]|nr:hypothetical protein [Clostridia bacterium]